MKNAYKIINRALKQAKLTGLKVIKDDWGISINSETGRYQLDSACGCPIGLVLAGKKASPGCGLAASAARILGKPKGWVDTFVGGFDGVSKWDISDAAFPDAFKFGRRLNKKYALTPAE
jgi:hypothetical protein